MKIYEEKTVRKKSWFIQMKRFNLNVNIQAVDSETGRFICNLIIFEEDGRIYTTPNSKSDLTTSGYDPCEHNNSWCNNGSINYIY